MMRVSLISTENFIVSHGLRIISACLKTKGYETKLIFLPLSQHDDLSDYQPSVLNNLIGLIENSDLIGISSMAISSHRAFQVANKIKKSLSAPLMWGGIYATTCPEECLQSADMVCIGEGEEAVLELIEKLDHREDYLSTENFWFKSGQKIIKNGQRALKESLDDLPFADYELGTQYILRGKTISSARDYFESNPDQIHGGQILVHTARGCPYSCSYCTNRFLNDLYKGKGSIIRKRSFRNVIDEIIQLKNKFPLARSVFITDDVFFLRDIDELEFFSREYSSQIGMPFQCYGAPPTIREDKLKVALKGGLDCVVMGIQTGSERLNRNVYKRFVSNEAVIRAARVLNQYKEAMMPPTYQFIISNPYETSDDLIETIRLLQMLPKPYTLEVSHLIFFPGCELYKKAISDGLIGNSQDAKYSIDYYDERRHLNLEKKNAYLHTLIYCMKGTALPSLMGCMPISFIDFFLRKKDSKWVYFYWLALLGIWRLRDAYLKTSSILPLHLKKTLSNLLKNAFISVGGLFEFAGKKKINKELYKKENAGRNKADDDLTFNKKPKVSVIIPTHNHAHFLPECLTSLRNQTYQDYEVIVVNNGSTDSTEEIVSNLSWDKLRYHYQNDTGSVAGPRNTGIRLAKGEYIAFLDSDDIWYKEKLERVVKALENNSDIDIISHDLLIENMIKQERKKRLIKSGPLSKNMIKSLFIRNRLLGSATVVKRKTILEAGGFDEDKDLVHAEDCDLWIRIAYLGKKFHFINEVLGEYRVHSANLSNDFETVLRNEINFMKKHFKKIRSFAPFFAYFLFWNKLSSVYFRFSIQYFFRRKFKKCIGCLLRSLIYNPFSLPFNVVSFIKSL